ncbi:MAG: hypothetical protein ABI747_01705 [Candidatus Moraniibacteriota bacterium]
MKYIRSIAFLVALVSLGIAHPALAVVGDATGLFIITKTGFVLNRATNTFDTTVSIKNTSPFTVSAPVQLSVSGLPNGVTLANAAGTSQGKPYVNVAVPGNNIIPNAIITPIVLKFSNPARVALAPKLDLSGDIPQYALGLPPDPGEAGKATVAGIDSNGNGVRDDVERWIAFNYPASAKGRAALMQYARAYQRLILSGAAGNPADALTLDQQAADASACSGYTFGVRPGILEQRKIFAEMLNTRARSLAYDQFNQFLAGQIVDRPRKTIADYRAACAGFDPDTLGN